MGKGPFMSERPAPFLMAIFGGSGDLTERKLIPSIYRLLKSGNLPKEYAVVGIGRSKMNHQEYRNKIQKGLTSFLERQEIDDSIIKDFLGHIFYHPTETDDATSYVSLKTYLEELNQKQKTHSNYIFYLATPPFLFDVIPKNLAECGLLKEDEGWKRVVLEKPFGRDLASAKKLNQDLLKIMNEGQIYRIDHYLGKETVQNIMAFRFANGMFEPIWNSHFIDSVQITVAEDIGLESRAGYYETAGALRDMVPNHLFQLLSLIAMEPPNSFESNEVRDEKVKVLRAINVFTPQEAASRVVRGQYDAGVENGEKVCAYRDEEDVDPQSKTETFVAMKLEIDNWRWAGVPFYMRTGKRLQKKLTEVAVIFKCPPFQMFQNMKCDRLSSNEFIFQIQPEEKITLCFAAKQPGQDMTLQNVALDFNYKDVFGKIPNTGYETLIFDCIRGDSTLFQRADQVDTAWTVVQPILDHWAKQAPTSFPNYLSGSWGPQASDDLLKADGRAWRYYSTGESQGETARTEEKKSSVVTAKNSDSPRKVALKVV
jgi:glucose-6-phosphate 1-dehydrogenase